MFHIDVRCRKFLKVWNVHESSAAAANEQQETHRERQGGSAGAGTGAEFVQVVFVVCEDNEGRRGRGKKKGDEGAASL